MAAIVDKEKCEGTKTCVGECPVDAITIEADKAVIDADKCIECGACVAVCPKEAISL